MPNPVAVRLPLSFFISFGRELALITVATYAPMPMPEAALREMNWQPHQIALLHGSVYTLWTKPDRNGIP